MVLCVPLLPMEACEPPGALGCDREGSLTAHDLVRFCPMMACGNGLQAQPAKSWGKPSAFEAELSEPLGL